MPNAFNTLIEPSQYVSQVVPLPLNEIIQMGAMKQQHRDATLANIEDTKNILSVKYDPHRKGVADELLSNYNQRLDDIANDFLKNDTNTANLKLSRIRRDFQQDPTRIGLENSYNSWVSYLKNTEENKKQGKYDNISGYDSYLHDKEQHSIKEFSPFNYSGDYTSEDIDKEAKSIMGKIAEDGSDTKGMKTDKQGNLLVDDNGMYHDYTTAGNGVSEPKLITLAGMKAEDFLKSNAGRYFIDRYTGGHVGNYNDFDDKTKLILKNLAANQLIHSSAEQIGWKTKGWDEGHFLPEYIAKDKQPKVDDTTHFGEDTPIINIVTNAFDIDKMVKKERFEVSGQGNPGSPLLMGTSTGAKAKSLGIGYGKLDEKEQKIYEGIAKNVFNVSDTKSLTGPKLDALNKKIKDYLINISTQNLSTSARSIPNNQSFDGSDKKGAEGLTEAIFGTSRIGDAPLTGNYINRDFYVASEGKTYSGEEFYNKFLSGLPKGTTIKIINQFSPNNPFVDLSGGEEKFARSYQVSVGGKSVIMSSAPHEWKEKIGVDGKSYYVDGTVDDRLINHIWKTSILPDKQIEMSVITKDNKPTQAHVVNLANGEYEMTIPLDHSVIHGETPEELLNNYHEYLAGK